MSASEHTPGPLVFHEGDDYINVLGEAEDGYDDTLALYKYPSERDRANAERIVRTWNSHDALVEALEATDRYWKACAVAWMDGGQVVNNEGKIIASAEGLDELADAAAPLVTAALAAARGSEGRSACAICGVRLKPKDEDGRCYMHTRARDAGTEVHRG